MVITGFLGSPRKNGNSAFLLKSFLKEAEALGAQTSEIHVPSLDIHPCTGCSLCEKKGVCCFEDDMQKVVFPLLRKSNLIVIASPIYFFNVPAELKALIDRSQTLWSRKFKLRLKDPWAATRKGFLLSTGATRGKNLFDGINLTMEYFFRGISTQYAGQLTYSRIESPGEIKKNPNVLADITKAVQVLIPPVEQTRPGVIFICRDNSLVSQMAAAFAKSIAGDKLRVLSAGIKPADRVHPELVPLMAEKGLDVAFRTPHSIPDALASCRSMTYAVIMTDGEDTAIHIPGAKILSLPVHNPEGSSGVQLKEYRDHIKQKVETLISEITSEP
jgi:multimeric flavodoxin WrbA/protein-tyrosine-phosphatase